MNVYRVYSEPRGKDQHIVLAESTEAAIAMLNGKITNPDKVQCFWRGRATAKQMTKAWPSNILIGPRKSAANESASTKAFRTAFPNNAVDLDVKYGPRGWYARGTTTYIKSH